MNAIEARNLGKCYRMRGMGPPTLLGTLMGAWRKAPEPFWALRDVSFDIKKGQTVGVIGPNGSGKSSLLGLAAGTIYPTTGQIRSQGRISSLLELGAGFHPDLSGRENVFLNAALLGIPREDIRKRLDHIIDFADLREFIDQPVKHYSSGMYVRLGFAVAVEVNPEVLLIDEVLAVGDITFQLKCLGRIREFQKKGKTLLFVSHALQTVEEFCDEVFLIHHGRLVERGAPGDTILKYIRAFMGEGGGVHTIEYGSRAAEITQVRLLNAQGQESASFETGSLMIVEIAYCAQRRIEKPVFGFGVKTANGQFIYGSNTQLAQYPIASIEGAGCIRLLLDPITLLHGNFVLSLSIHSWDHAEQFHRREDWYPFAVRNPTAAPGLFQLQSRWENA